MEVKGNGNRQIHQHKCKKSTKQKSLDTSRSCSAEEDVEISQKFANLSVSGHLNQEQAVGSDKMAKKQKACKPSSSGCHKTGSLDSHAEEARAGLNQSGIC